MESLNGRKRLSVVGGMLLWCGLLIFYRIYRAEDILALGLLWNLFLAVIPLLMSAGFQSAIARKRLSSTIVYFALWRLFLPNAPYILTDLIHLSPRPHVPLWFMLAMLLSCAGTGTLMGYLSLINVQNAITLKFGALAGWAVAISSLMACGFGIYIGRFLRWNSWDALTRPFQLAKTVILQFIDPGSHPHPVGVTLVFGCGLLIGYIALHVVASTTMMEHQGT